MIGIVFNGLDRSGLRIPQMTLFEWISYSESIKQQNLIIDKRISQVSSFFYDRAIRSIVLKGQANGKMYPNPELRSPGDIDLWCEGNDIDIIKVVLNACPKAKYSLHHIKMPVFKDVSVEVHYSPVHLMNWFKDRKLQSYIDTKRDDLFGNGELTEEFNILFLLLHMYHHFFESRNNFKQFIDYYYLLKHAVDKYSKDEIIDLLKQWGVLCYAKGIMWVMNTTLGLEENYLYIEKDDRIGKLILEESMKFGTFSRNKFVQVFQQFIGNMRLVRFFPSEVIIGPLFLVWHQLWKVKMKWRLALV